MGSGGTVTINGDDDDDTFNFDSKARPTPRGRARLNDNILGIMLINGGNGTDALNLDDRTLDSLSNVLTLTSTTITGLGLTGGITYSTFESLSILPRFAATTTANIQEHLHPDLAEHRLGRRPDLRRQQRRLGQRPMATSPASRRPSRSTAAAAAPTRRPSRSMTRVPPPTPAS